jgi:hypothetical protein
MSAQTRTIPMQAGDRKLCDGYRGKDDMQDEQTCEFLNANDYSQFDPTRTLDIISI